MLRIVSCLAWSGIGPLAATPLPRPYTVENYDASIQADLPGQRLNGEVKIRFHSRADDAISALELDAGGLQIASVLEGQSAQWFERKGSLLVVALTNPLRPDEHRTITVRYQAGPAPGLKFFADQVYGSVASDWMPCNDRPGERATLHLAITAPHGFQAAGSGRLTATRSAGERSITEWQLDSATTPSWFGFALGTFAENRSEAEGVKLRVLGAGTQVLEPTAAALHYLEESSGKPYPGTAYTQVFAHGDVARSLAGLALLPESYATGLPKQADALWLLTSELARQWYGLGVVSKDWADLWLSDGVSAFLGDEFVGERLGKAAFQREIERSQQIYNQIRAQGKDHALFNTEWTTRQDAGGEIPIHKGACFLYLLHDLIGDSAFREGLRLYTSGEWGQAATSQDFQRVLIASSRGNRSAEPKKHGAAERKNGIKAVDNLFDLWVYGITSGVTK